MLRDPARAILVKLERRPMTADELEAFVEGARWLLPGLEADGKVERVGEGWRYLRGLD